MPPAKDNSEEKHRFDERLKQMGDRIRTLRKQNGFTNADFFAYQHNISRAQYQRYENGQDLQFTSIVRLANAFGISLSEFFSEGFD